MSNSLCYLSRVLNLFDHGSQGPSKCNLCLGRNYVLQKLSLLAGWDNEHTVYQIYRWLDKLRERDHGGGASERVHIFFRITYNVKDFFVSIPRKQANENQATIVDIIIGPFFLTIVLFYIFFSCVILNWSYWENLLPVNQQTNIWQQQQKTTTTINRRMKTNRWKLTPCIQQCDLFRKFVLTSSLFVFLFLLLSRIDHLNDFVVNFPNRRQVFPWGIPGRSETRLCTCFRGA